MIVIIDTRKQTVTISQIDHFGELVDWEDYLDYEVILEPPSVMEFKKYLDEMQNPSHT